MRDILIFILIIVLGISFFSIDSLELGLQKTVSLNIFLIIGILLILFAVIVILAVIKRNKYKV